MLSLFYTRREIATRVSILYSESTVICDDILDELADFRRQHHRYRGSWTHQCGNICHIRRRTWYRRVAMALHHPRCSYIRYRHHCTLGTSRSSTDDSMAQAGGATASSFSNGARYSRSRREQRCLGRSQTSRQGL